MQPNGGDLKVVVHSCQLKGCGGDAEHVVANDAGASRAKAPENVKLRFAEPMPVLS